MNQRRVLATSQFRAFLLCGAVGGVLLSLAVAAARAAAPETSADDEPALELPAEWVGASPIGVDDLRGKAALLYFYEETCPKCKGKWVDIMATAAQYQGKPIAFIAVNSGTSRSDISQYARSVKLTWPVIVDADRSFEKACNVGEISLQNITQYVYITADGEFHRGDWRDLPGTIERALEGAEWTIDPEGMPEEVKTAWRLIEFGQYPASVQELKKAMASKDSKVKAAAKQLTDEVTSRGKAALAAAAETEKSSGIAAYQQYAGVAARFAGYRISADAEAAQKRLAGDPAFKAELAAVKRVQELRVPLNSSQPAVQQRAKDALEKIIADSPDTEAARLAKELLGQA